MDLYFLNFKQVLVVLSDKDMRLTILKIIKDQEIDVNLKFVNSYFEAATLIQTHVHDPYDHIILNLGVSGRKFKDFKEYIDSIIDSKPDFLIEYDTAGKLIPKL